MTPDEFREAGHRFVDFITDYRMRVESGELPVMAQTEGPKNGPGQRGGPRTTRLIATGKRVT